MKNIWLKIKSFFKKKKEVEIHPRWHRFHELDADRIYILADRATGKTFNMFYHLLESDNETALWVCHSYFNLDYLIKIISEEFDLKLERSGTIFNIKYKGKEKKVYFVSSKGFVNTKGLRVDAVYVDDAKLNVSLINALTPVSNKLIITDDRESNFIDSKEAVDFLFNTMDAHLIIK